ncbi:MAG TPA: MlaD family protein [Steroidobacteraceae bacterium]|jgi:phospholipid/cholesterol/gamma-HCH transport system substrate-binding protein|nr:MlaD family protein [Steroidobacteraceae bacterium]
MEREANYAAVGAFVLLVTLLGALFVYWYSDTREHRDYIRYEIYFTGSVSGLEKGAAVRYLGVPVGRVNDLRIDPRDSSRAQVIVDVDATTPVSEHTVAELQLQGITGLLYIDLSEDRTGKRATPLVAQMRYPVIRSAPSQFDVLLAGLPELVAAAGNLVNRASRLLSDDNLATVTESLGNLNRASADLPRTLHELNSLIAELRGASAELQAAAHTATGTLQAVDPQVRAAAERLHGIADSLASASSQLDQTISENRQDIRAFARDGLPEIERFVREGRAAAHDIRELSNSLRENPTQLLYQPPQRGVEIPR